MAVISRTSRALVVVCVALCVAIATTGCASHDKGSHPVPSGLAPSLESGVLAAHAQKVCRAPGPSMRLLAAGDSTVSDVKQISQKVENRESAADFSFGMPKSAHSYLAICMYSTMGVSGVSPKYKYMALWTSEMGSNGIITLW